jgi:hypothetical protein
MSIGPSRRLKTAQNRTVILYQYYNRRGKFPKKKKQKQKKVICTYTELDLLLDMMLGNGWSGAGDNRHACKMSGFQAPPA